MIDYKKSLNKEQLRVVHEGDGACLVLSGPGSGKTRTLVHRTAYLLEKGVPGEKVLLLTFTKKAAKNMLHRVSQIINRDSSEVKGGTFHHVGNTFLRRYASTLGYSERFIIMDEEDSKEMISSILKNKDVKLRAPFVQNVISISKNAKKDASHFTEDHFEQIEDVKEEYEKRKKENNLMDYDDLLLNWLKLLSFDEIKKELSSAFSYILVDEYQDTNALQDEIVKEMSRKHGNVLAVGDESQSIFSFRAADVSNILRFSSNYPQAKIFYLETNYRSTPQILTLANEVIRHNKERFEKELKSIEEGGASPQIKALESPFKQAHFITSKIDELRRSGIPLSEIAVLFRAHYQSAELEIDLAKKGIPYIMRGGVRFFEQAHVKDLAAFLRIIVNFRDETSWMRLLSRMRGVGKIYASRALEEILKRESLDHVCTQKEEISCVVSSRAKEGILFLLSLLQEAKIEASTEKITEIFMSRFYENYLRSFFDNPEERITDLNRFCDLSAKYESIEDVIAEFSLSEDFQAREGGGDAVTLSTVHQAKGLEWDTVFVISLKEGDFPYIKAVEEGSIEEERRLFYVAVTRCKKNLFLTYPVYSFRNSSMPSRFLSEAESEPEEEEIIITEEMDDGEWLCM